MNPYQALLQAINYYADSEGKRGVPRLAAACGFGVTRVDNMRARRAKNPDLPLPADWGLVIEAATKGHVRREQLCPNVKWSIGRRR